MLFRIAAASVDFGLHLLTKTSSGTENVFPFGGGLSGHHGKINDICFCGGRNEDNVRYVATVSGQSSFYFSSDTYAPKRETKTTKCLWYGI